MTDIDPATLDFTASPEYVNRTQRYVLPVPGAGDHGDPLVVPAGDARAGQVLRRDRHGAPARGVVFFNAVDSAWQAAIADGSEAILVNDVGGAEASLLGAWLEARGSASIDLGTVRALLDHARTALRLIDVYHKRLASVRRDMAPVELKGDPHHWIVTKSTRHRALRVDRPFAFNGPVRQHYPDGAVLVNDGRHTWGVATEVFLRCYRRIDGNREVGIGRVEALRR